MMEQPVTQESEEVVVPPETTKEPADTSFDSSPEVIDEPLETEIPVDDDEEVDYDGEKYKVPKKLKDAFLRQQDYTQKTQQVAEQRKVLEQQTAQNQQHAHMTQQYIAEYAEALSLDKELAQYKQVNWTQLIDADPVQAMKLDRQMREIQSRRDQVVASVSQKQQAQAIDQQRFSERQINEGRAVLEREIKGWTPETAKTLKEFGIASGAKYGVQPRDFDNINLPFVVKLLHDSYTLDQLMKAKVSKPSPVAQERPVTRITASKATVKTPATMTDNEFARWRKSQIKNRN